MSCPSAFRFSWECIFHRGPVGRIQGAGSGRCREAPLDLSHEDQEGPCSRRWADCGGRAVWVWLNVLGWASVVVMTADASHSVSGPSGLMRIHDLWRQRKIRCGPLPVPAHASILWLALCASKELTLRDCS